jgi:hypothetical protein
MDAAVGSHWFDKTDRGGASLDRVLSSFLKLRNKTCFRGNIDASPMPLQLIESKPRGRTVGFGTVAPIRYSHFDLGMAVCAEAYDGTKTEHLADAHQPGKQDDHSMFEHNRVILLDIA